MAMDNFREEIVVKRHNMLANLLYYFAWISLAVFGIIGIFTIQMVLNSIGRGPFPWAMLIIGVVMIALAALVWIKKDTLRVEYEYTFTNGVLDVSMVLNNAKRRYLTELNLKTVEACGRVSHPSFQRYLSDRNIKKHNWFLNRDSDLVYFCFSKNSVRHLVIIEPSEEMVKLINNPRYLGFGIWQK